MKKIINILFICILISNYINVIYAVGDVDISGGTGSETVNSLVGNIWTTVSIVIYTLAVGCIVFAGLRYMLSSADAKADIKKQTRYVTCGSKLSVWGYVYYKSYICYNFRE